VKDHVLGGGDVFALLIIFLFKLVRVGK